jgi:Fur family transcriptional regulator, zinc uptake regulator
MEPGRVSGLARWKEAALAVTLDRAARSPLRAARPAESGHDHAACAHVHRHSREAEPALARAEAACRERGVRLTPIRRKVLQALFADHRPLGAYDIAEALGGEAGRRLAPITIYRALDFLMEQGLVHRLASRNAFIACPHGHQPQDLVAFLICEGCGGVDEIASPGVAGAVDEVMRRERFEPRSQLLEISGLCGHCRAPA